MWHKESILGIVIEALRRVDSLSRFDLAFVQCEVAVGIGVWFEDHSYAVR